MGRIPAAVRVLRTSIVVIAATSLAVGVLAAPALADGADQHGETLNIIPPGSKGTVTLGDLLALGVTKVPDALASQDPTQLIVATPVQPPNYDNQLAMYDALNRLTPTSITGTNLLTYYKDARLGGVPSTIVSTEHPKAGVTVKRDTMGVPHITGETSTDVAWGAGWAGIQDRMFLTDVLRHAGSSTLAAFLGPSAGNIAMDQAQLRTAPYPRAEAEAQILKAVQRYGAEGQALVNRLDAYIAGMNAAVKSLCPVAFGLPVPGNNGVGLGPSCPIEYVVLQKNPELYTRGDIIYIASLVGGVFGKGGGGEYVNALWLQALVSKYGQARGRQIYNELRAKDDPEAFDQATTSFPYLTGDINPNRPGVAMPVPGATVANGTGTDAGGSGLPIPVPPLPGTAAAHEQQQSLGDLRSSVGGFDFRRLDHDTSNAVVIGAKLTADGHPTAVFGPQTGYYTPQLLSEVDLHGPGIDARGVSFAGTQFIVELGHGRDYAWSATSADGDMVDTVMERLCNSNGAAPTVNSTSYIRNGSCVPLDHYVHDEGIVIPTAGGTGTPSHLRFHVYRTDHGIVEFRTLAHDGGTNTDVPVAVVTERSTYGHEADSALGFARVNNPDYVHSAGDFQHAFNAVDYSFNWFYADSEDIAYFNSGLLPQRPPSVDPDLPRWGDSAYDWSGFLPFAQHPQQINPPRGFTASWNNKQAPGFGAADNLWGQGPVHRVNLLVDGVEANVRAGHKMKPPDVVAVMMRAATIDLRAEKLLPLALEVIGNDPQAAGAIALFRSWLADDAHRVDRKRTGTYDHAAAIALFDRWWDDKGSAKGGLAKATLRPGLGALVDGLPQPTDDHPRSHVGSAFITTAWYGYVSRTLRQTLGQPVNPPYASSYCGSLAVCRASLRLSLHTAIADELAAQQVSSVNDLTYDKSDDSIESVTAGVVGVPPIDWQNRPTFQQVIHYTSRRLAVPNSGRVLPTTGSPTWAPLLGLGFLAVCVAAVALRRRVAPAGT